jgi:S-DNA-T family DNA segregation ATPase FtsK/SpoIIIE
MADSRSMSKRASSAARSSRRAAPADDREPVSTAARLWWLVGLFAWLLVLVSLVSHAPADPPGHVVAGGEALAPTDAGGGAGATVENWAGMFGAVVSHELFTMLGVGVWLLIAGVGVWLGVVAWRGPVSHPLVRFLGLVMAAMAVSGFHALLLPTLTPRPEGAGGLLMIAATDALVPALGVVGTALTLLMTLTIGAWVAADSVVLAAGRWMLAAFGITASRSAAAAKRLAERRAAARANDIDDDTRLKTVERFLGVGKARAKAERAAAAVDERAGGLGGGAAFDDEAETPTRTKKGKAAQGQVEAKPAHADDEEWDEEEYEYDDEYEYEYDDEGEWDEDEDEADSGDEAAEDDDDDLPGAPQVFDADALKEKIAKLPVRFAGASKKMATQEDLDKLRAQRRSEEEADRNYRFPGLDLLVDPEENFNEELESWVRQQAEALEQALHTYNIEGEVVGIDSGPVITLYRVRLAPGTKVAQLGPIAADIARMLRAVNIRIVPNEEGHDTVGIEVPNRKKEKVRLKELMTNSEAAGRMKLPMFLGKDASGNPLVIDLTSLPHMLIAGTTGSGKSVCMNAIIMGFLYTQKPSDLKLVLVDPKMVELSQFRDIPHLMCPVITEMSKAAAILEWAVTKMDERYELLAEAGVRDIATYNGLSWEELKERFDPKTELEEAKIPRKLPYMVFVIDELADLMMTNKEVEGSIVRIAQKARAVGIHLILATQRPQANVVTGLIKSNMPGRLSFRVASGMDSRIVLDQKGGELLLGHGDMLMLTPRSSVPIRSQGTLVDDAEIRAAVRFIRDVSAPSFESDLKTIANSGFGGGDQEAAKYTAEEYEERMRRSAQEDPLFDRAVEIVLETRRGSVSLLQRRLAIGYTRASRLIELMGQTGIIGDHKGSVAREVLMSAEEWDALKEFAAQQEAERAAGGPAPESLFPDDERDDEFVVDDDEAPDEQLGATGAGGGESTPTNADAPNADTPNADTPTPDMPSAAEPKSAQPTGSAEPPPFDPDDGAARDDRPSGSRSTEPPEPLQIAPALAAAGSASAVALADEPEADADADADAEELTEVDEADEYDEDDTEWSEDDEAWEDEDDAAEDAADDEETEEGDDEEDVEYVYVDEDGNEIDPDDAEYEYDDEYEDDEDAEAEASDEGGDEDEDEADDAAASADEPEPAAPARRRA